MVHDPLSPSEALRTRTGIALVALGVIVFIYSLVIIGEFLVGILFFLLPGGLYLTYRVFAVLDSVADAAQRHVAVREREANRSEGATSRERSVRGGEGGGETTETASQFTERER